MANIKINDLALYTGDTTGAYFIMNNSGETATYKVTRETILGTSGNAGSSGSSGTSGSSGSSGSNGSSGTSGSSGSSGTSGNNGSSGTSGSNGSSGTSGSSGSSGSSGTSPNMSSYNGNSTINGDLTVTGSITAQQFVVSSSVYYVTESSVSGSSNFGNTLDDNHNFTGSVYISGSLNISGSIGANLWQLRDVNDTASGSITNGYQLAWNSSSSIWEPTAGAAAKGNIRLYMATNRSNANAIYFNANTRTASDSASPSADTAFMVTTNLLTKATVYLRMDSATSPNSTVVSIYKNADGSAFSSATQLATSTLNLTTNTTQIYSFTGLTINQYDSLHVYCDPTTTPGVLYAIVTVE